MHFNLSIQIHRAPEDVFVFLRDKHLIPQQEGSPVLSLEKLTPGAVGIGTLFREVVRILPFLRAEILSRVTRFEPYTCLQEEFWGNFMRGWLTYTFSPHAEGTLLVQDQIFEPLGLMRLLIPLAKNMLSRRLLDRIKTIRAALEGEKPAIR